MAGYEVKGTGVDAQTARLIQDENSETHKVVVELVKAAKSTSK